jgi:SMC interacting uncharacterized protein involved in chromosome segregation
MTLDWNIIIGLVGILSTLSMIVLGIVKLPAERKKMNADSAKSFAEAAKISEEAAALSAKRALAASDDLESYKIQVKVDIDELKCEVEKLKKENKLKDEMIVDLQLQLDDVQDWAERLVFQVKSLGGDPVKIRKRKV